MKFFTTFFFSHSFVSINEEKSLIVGWLVGARKLGLLGPIFFHVTKKSTLLINFTYLHSNYLLIGNSQQNKERERDIDIYMCIYKTRETITRSFLN